PDPFHGTRLIRRETGGPISRNSKETDKSLEFVSFPLSARERACIRSASYFVVRIGTSEDAADDAERRQGLPMRCVGAREKIRNPGSERPLLVFRDGGLGDFPQQAVDDVFGLQALRLRLKVR